MWRRVLSGFFWAATALCGCSRPADVLGPVPGVHRLHLELEGEGKGAGIPGPMSTSLVLDAKVEVLGDEPSARTVLVRDVSNVSLSIAGVDVPTSSVAALLVGRAFEVVRVPDGAARMGRLRLRFMPDEQRVFQEVGQALASVFFVPRLEPGDEARVSESRNGQGFDVRFGRAQSMPELWKRASARLPKKPGGSAGPLDVELDWRYVVSGSGWDRVGGAETNDDGTSARRVRVVMERLPDVALSARSEHPTPTLEVGPGEFRPSHAEQTAMRRQLAGHVESEDVLDTVENRIWFPTPADSRTIFIRSVARLELDDGLASALGARFKEVVASPRPAAYILDLLSAADTAASQSQFAEALRYAETRVEPVVYRMYLRRLLGTPRVYPVVAEFVGSRVATWWAATPSEEKTDLAVAFGSYAEHMEPEAARVVLAPLVADLGSAVTERARTAAMRGLANAPGYAPWPLIRTASTSTSSHVRASLAFSLRNDPDRESAVPILMALSREPGGVQLFAIKALAHFALKDDERAELVRRAETQALETMAYAPIAELASDDPILAAKVLDGALRDGRVSGSLRASLLEARGRLAVPSAAREGPGTGR